MKLSVVLMEESQKPTVKKKPNQYRVLRQGGLLRLLVPFLLLCVAFSFFCIYSYLFRNFGPQSTALGGFRTCANAGNPDSLALEHWLRPSTNLLHNMTDKELFWRALCVPQIKDYPYARVPKIAFLFLTKGPLPLSPLWERFFKGQERLYSIYIHTMPSYHLNFSSSSVFYQRQIPSQPTGWGMMSVSDAERRLLANALLDISNERFVLVSESCIPMYNFTFVYTYITKSKHSFLNAFDDPSGAGRGRYNSHMQPEVYLADWRKGDQWFEVSRKVAILIVEDTKFHPKFQKFCIPRSCYTDEQYFPTMMTIKAAHLLANRTLTYTDWSRRGAHPATFREADVTEEFFKNITAGTSCVYNDQMTSVCFLFARKFAPSALQPLLLLAPRCFGY